jgi:hypothetical protein
MQQTTTAITALALALTGLPAPDASATASRLQVRIVHISGRGGMDWGDAGIGAAAGAGITLLGLGGALVISQRHPHPTAGHGPPGADSPPRASQPTQKRTDVQ